MTRNFHWFGAFAKLKRGVTLKQATAQMDTIGARIARDYPDSNKGWGVNIELFADTVVGTELRQSLLVLLSAVGMILLIGCANLANLTLARGTAREREVAIRASIGAGRWRLVRQFLTENVLLSICGGKSTAQVRLDAEDIEVVRRHPVPAQLNRLIDAGERHRTAGLCGHVLEDGVVFLPVEIIQRRDAVTAPARRFLQDPDDPFRLAIRQRLQQHAVHKAENRRVGADADPQRQDGDDGKPRTLPEGPQSIAQILK
jgi:hypothetical protein